jgi:hypothetical protein
MLLILLRANVIIFREIKNKKRRRKDKKLKKSSLPLIRQFGNKFDTDQADLFFRIVVS